MKKRIVEVAVKVIVAALTALPRVAWASGPLRSEKRNPPHDCARDFLSLRMAGHRHCHLRMLALAPAGTVM